jgi:hypothetical protein
MLTYDFVYYCSFRTKFPYTNAFEMLDLNNVTKMAVRDSSSEVDVSGSMFHMFDCYKYMDISGSRLEANVSSLSEGF